MAEASRSFVDPDQQLVDPDEQKFVDPDQSTKQQIKLVDPDSPSYIDALTGNAGTDPASKFNTAIAGPVDTVGGLMETVAAPVAGLAAAVPGTVAGLGNMALGSQGTPGDRFVSGFQAVTDPVNRLMEPETNTGKALLGGLSNAFEYLPGKAGEATFKATNSPLAATAAETVVRGAEYLLPFARRSGKAITREEAPKAISTAAQEVASDTRDVFTPREIARGSMRENAAEFARKQELAFNQLNEFSKQLDNMPDQDRLAFIDAIEEKGAKASWFQNLSPELRPVARELTNALDDRLRQVQKFGKLDNFIEDYFPHFWKDPDAAANLFSKRSLTGPGGFLKERTIPTVKEGIEMGLEPLTTNPIDLTLLKVREMDRYVMGQKIFGELKDNGIAQFVRFGEKPPEGWQKVNDKIARVYQYSEAEKGFINRGEYYAPSEVARDINNFLSPGLKGNPNPLVSGSFNTARVIGNMMNSAQLGLSGFHLGFTTLDATISQTALGIKQLVEGHPISAAANIAGTPVAPITNLIRGAKLEKAYKLGTEDPTLQKIVDSLIAGGGRIKMDEFYKSANWREFKEAFRRAKDWRPLQLAEDGTYVPGKLPLSSYATVLRQAVPLAIDALNYPIFQWLVPKQKLGVFFNMAKYELEKNPNMSPTELRDVMGKAWDSVDNRMGEMVYDNLFWNRMAKDLSFVAVRSVGWNLGTIRELGGGAVDFAKSPLTKEMTHRMSYVVALPLVIGIIGGMLNYLYTGEGPKEPKDYFFPRTGNTRPDGSEDRVSLPSYMKDIYEYKHDPVQTVKNKIHPMASMISQMLDNKDFYGAAIVDPDDEVMKQAGDFGKYMAKQFTPFSIRNYQQQKQVKDEKGSLTDYLTSPSMYGITPAPGYIVKSDEQQEQMERKLRRPAVRKKMKQERREADQ